MGGIWGFRPPVGSARGYFVEIICFYCFFDVSWLRLRSWYCCRWDLWWWQLMHYFVLCCSLPTTAFGPLSASSCWSRWFAAFRSRDAPKAPPLTLNLTCWSYQFINRSHLAGSVLKVPRSSEPHENGLRPLLNLVCNYFAHLALPCRCNGL